MNVFLVDKLEESLNQHVKQGRYRSASEVVRQGLHILEIREAQLTQKPKEAKKSKEK